MKNSEITKLIKEYAVNTEYILSSVLSKRIGVKSYYDNNSVYYAPSTITDKKETMQWYVDSLLNLGYTIISKSINEREKDPMTTIIFGTHFSNLTLVLSWSNGISSRDYGRLGLFLVDGMLHNVKMDFSYFHKGAIGMLRKVIADWENVRKEMLELNARINKIRMKLSMGRNTIDVILQNFLERNTHPYTITQTKGDTYLKIKLSFHRYIEIKLLPTMDMTKIAQIAKMINEVDEAMRSVGNINLTVKNYGNNIDWKNPEGI